MSARAFAWTIQDDQEASPKDNFVVRLDVISTEKRDRFNHKSARLFGHESNFGPVPAGGMYIFATSACVSVNEFFSGRASGYFASSDFSRSNVGHGGRGVYASEGSCLILTIAPNLCTGTHYSNNTQSNDVSILLVGVGTAQSINIEGTTNTRMCSEGEIFAGPLSDLKRTALNIQARKADRLGVNSQ